MSGVTLVFLLFATSLIHIFTKDADVIRTGTLALKIIGSGYVFYGIGMVIIQAFNRAGDTRTPTLINFMGFWTFHIPLALLLAKGLNFAETGTFIAIMVAETAIAIAAIILFKKGKWKQVQI